ncbi:hypothetical protein QWZ03_00365 [Chitinimonas viridis]|uniref:Uncharacterized protein n=1 Tax=Chitinimonas viridis TaxID=664880 RepID=A0ABT8AZF3_9NEIS|nr:DUF6585 family protein [Chitinimonas viridis]MDN3575226.1 hypothetical protein [Chitinimonas viridis]
MQTTYSMTYMARAMATLVLGTIFMFCFGDLYARINLGQPWSEQGVSITLGSLSLALLAFIWVFHHSKRVTYHGDRISVSSLLGEKSIKLDEHTKIRHQLIHMTGHDSTIALHRLLEIAPQDRVNADSMHINIHLSDGQNQGQLKLNSNVRGIIELHQRLVAFERNTITPTALKHLSEGRAMHFGPLTLQRDTLVYKDLSLPRDQIEKITIAGGKLLIKQKGKLLSAVRLPVHKIPNAFALLAALA